MVEWLTDHFSALQGWFFESAVQPLVYAVGLGGWTEDAFDATGWLLVGLMQILVLLAVIGPLQRWRPAELVVDKRAIRTDILYTLIHRLGFFRLAIFFLLQPVFDDALGSLRGSGWGTLHLDELWPGVTDVPWIAFAMYLVVLDFVEYLIHRGQHGFTWWWGLHSLHHSQRQMTMWSDNRNHLLDDLLRDSLLVVVGQLIGVGPGQFVAIVAIAQLSESLQHANVRLHFGRIGERLWISPRFHRLHHSIGLGHERKVVGALLEKGRSPALGGHNFGVLLPWWDVLFRTANFELRWDPTGVRDQVEQGRDYGGGFWSQQWLGVLRLVGKA